jgi:heat shock protein HtpX
MFFSHGPSLSWIVASGQPGSQVRSKWFSVLLLLVAPTVSGLLRMAISRTREFDADLGTARLIGDPLGLALALSTMACYEKSWLQRVF